MSGFWIVIILLVILLVAAISRSSRRSYRRANWAASQAQNSGLSVLNERYAKGEITKEEYDQKKKDLGV